MKLAAAVSITMALMLGYGHAQEIQSLADLARQQRAARSQRGSGDRTITTEEASIVRPGSSLTLSRLMSPDAPAPADTTPSPETPADSAEPEDGPVDPAALGDDEQAWRAAFADARAEVERTRNRLELLQLELSDLNNQLLTRSDIYNREYQIQPLITAKEGEIREAQRALGDANQAVEALSTTLQRADLPLGWAR